MADMTFLLSLVIGKERDSLPIWELHNEKLRCIKPLLSISGFSYGSRYYRAQGNIFSDTPK